MKKIYLLFLSIAIISMSCEEESNPTFDTDNFTAIFDNNQFAATYNPIDFKQTADGGYLVLGTRDLADSPFSGIYLLRTDKYGNFVSEQNVDEQYVHPIASLTEIGGAFYFICMDELNVKAHVVQVSDSGRVVIAKEVANTYYPAAASFAEDKFVILGYDNENKKTTLTLSDEEGNVSGDIAAYSIGVGETKDVEKQITSHFIRTGRQLPFSVGKTGNQYYFNGFYNYTLSMLFTNMAQEEPDGGVQGQRENENSGLSAMLPLGGSKFAISWFNGGQNFFLPNATLLTSGGSESIGEDEFKSKGLPFRELVPDASVRIIRAQVNAKNALIFGSTTLAKQIGLFFYDETSGAFMSSRYLGFSNPFEIASIIQTSDEGIAVCGTTYLAGRFPRICIFKISKEELAKNSR